MRCQRHLEVLIQNACVRPIPSLYYSVRTLSTKSPQYQESEASTIKDSRQNGAPPEDEGAMSRRMRDMSEEAMLGGKSAMKNMQEAGFSDELKRQLEERIAAASFKNEHAQAWSVVNMPRSAGRGTQNMAAAAPWTGTENIHDTALRMLDDSSKPLRTPFKIPSPVSVNAPPRIRGARTSGQRLAQARERKEAYELTQDSQISKEEREAYRRELHDRFTPGARSLPVSLQGLSSLANERIEDAIAQGQFRNLPRGKGKNVERDHAAANPYLDTTEYFMNRILQKQELAPEWIQKQQELKLELHRFRTQLRSDWKRHAARLISSQGGSLQLQIRRAQAYAAAESRHNKAARCSVPTEYKDATGAEPRTQIDNEGRLSRTLRIEATPNSTESNSENEPEPLPNLPCLRDPQYLSVEKEYHELKIKKLNDLVRSYNLQAPQIAQRPYVNLQRELDTCYADVAPSLADEVHRRATQRSHEPGRVSMTEATNPLQQVLGLGKAVRVYDEDTAKGYGMKQFWRDLWNRQAPTAQ
ncbi:hypothetical protein LOZ61_001944 [Ophidiomyces ophidiicola]|uniref:Uncharacterized protein n=1 Tax=Ophidiomyces ophidiicola TaxID=1387563 RepID=A0ACB8V460_9EURO|nr:uncharacterized protein LOZ57_005118 [Ophidiomyces ophidiicola]KAI1915020.1 hypothetical protein LOZ61_001944 [Ophidiomyces ophidiicola]KAI1923299.1 hypothetical protein LOZ64_000974 [Ophidiomyces ophidiicola]KAI1930126.1 hypothetical protein LOZ60_001185 [Ophidiomyces ophidiicola]KAI1943171.1 hypothetical protein LOZ57_005118 [Ophidiomyces ophidiicola]KAI1965108.1 hypothetical protein LOZ59_001434 [Ophidiomyces ophidiicola]